MLGLTPPMATRKATSRMAESLAASEGAEALKSSLPPKARLSRFSSAILFSDFLDPPEAIAQRLKEMAEGDVQGHLMQVLDPAEETLAYQGRMEFRSPEGGERWIADRVETLRDAYQPEARRASRSASRRRRAGSAGRSWCTTPTGPPPSRC